MNRKIKILCECAVMLALATTLSFIKVYQLPLGGSITLLSMLPIVLISIRHGIGYGLGTSLVYSLIQLFLDLGSLLSWGLTPAVFIGSLFFDYLLAFTVLGLSGLFRNKGTVGVIAGVSLSLVVRFLSHFLSGIIFFRTWERFNSPFLWSLFYNGSFMLPELILTVAATAVLLNIPYFKKNYFSPLR